METLPGEAGSSPFAAVIAAAGSSSRMGAEGKPPPKKEYLPLGLPDGAGKPLTVLGASVLAFAGFSRIETIVIAVPAQGELEARKALPEYLFASPEREKQGPRLLFVPGGSNRRVSVHHALSLLAAYQPGLVLIHDGARPWVSAALISAVIRETLRYGAVIPLLPLVETPKEVDGKGFILRHLRRAGAGTAQTPQGFLFPEILRAHEKAAEKELAEGYEYTDDAEVWGEFCGPVATVPGESGNRKITFPGDLGVCCASHVKPQKIAAGGPS
ncbi:MAG: 2-C-methyl-D-erythritol 4-phosphate cytidylyltransferase [Treponema sp.]|jgi:2-C-methyl-D-erythritol 4-phosphate cytidylyltransferase|nr:2-C-methyl-D-erythritol 4-phosphate cytidylyltransferase [Treponema sp.]